MATKKKAAKPAAKKTAAKPVKAAASSSKTKYVYTWGAGKADGNGSMKALLGGKGANLAEMTRIGLPVPPGFTVSTEVCTYFYANKRTYPATLQGQMEAGVKNMEKEYAAARVTWAYDPIVPAGGQASVPLTLTLTTANDQVATSRVTVLLVDDRGWWVCDVQKTPAAGRV